MTPRWSSLRANRPYQQAGMSVEVYYRQFCDWKDEIDREGHQCSEASLIDDFIIRMTWDLLVRMYGYPAPPFSLSEAFKRAQFEESIISLEELTRQIRADKVFEEMSHPISIDTAETQGVEDDYFRLQLKSNRLHLNTINRWNECEIKNAYVEGSLTEEAKKDEQSKAGMLESMEIVYPLADQVELKLNAQLQASGNGDFGSTIAAKKLSDECLQLLHSPHKVAEISSHSLLGAEAIVIYLKAGNIVVENDAFYVFDKLTKPMQIYVPGANRGMTSDQYKHNSILEVGPFLTDLYSCCENILMYVIVGERKDVNSLNDIDGILMFIFDPGGSSLFYDECDLFQLNGKQGDRCFTTIADDASVRFDEYYNDAFNEESVCPSPKVVPILELVVSIQIGIIVKVYDVPIHAGVLPNRESHRVFAGWNGEEFLIPMVDKNIIIIKTSSDLKGEGSSTPEFLNDHDFRWVSLFIYFNTLKERGSQLGSYILISIKLISQGEKSLFSKSVILKESGKAYTRVVIAGLKPLELWLRTCELDGSLLDQNFMQPPRLFWKWIVWRSLCWLAWNLLLTSSFEMLGFNRVNSVATGTTLIIVDHSLESSISSCWDIKKTTVVKLPPQNCKWTNNIILASEFTTTGRQLPWVGYVAALNGDEEDVYFDDKSTEIVISLLQFGDDHERFFIYRSRFLFKDNVAGPPGSSELDMNHQVCKISLYSQVAENLASCYCSLFEPEKKYWLLTQDFSIIPRMGCNMCFVDLLGCERLVDETYKFIQHMPLELDVSKRNVLWLANKIELMEVTNRNHNLWHVFNFGHCKGPCMIEISYFGMNNGDQKVVFCEDNTLVIFNWESKFHRVIEVGQPTVSLSPSQDIKPLLFYSSHRGNHLRSTLGDLELLATCQSYKHSRLKVNPCLGSIEAFVTGGTTDNSQVYVLIHQLARIYVFPLHLGALAYSCWCWETWKKDVDISIEPWDVGVPSGVMGEWLGQHGWTVKFLLLPISTSFVSCSLVPFKVVDSWKYTSALFRLEAVFVVITTGVSVMKIINCNIGMPHLMSNQFNRNSFWRHSITGRILKVVDVVGVFTGAMTNSFANDTQEEEVYDDVFGDVSPNVTLLVCVEDAGMDTRTLVGAIVTGISMSDVKLENFVWDPGLYMSRIFPSLRTRMF